MSSSLLRSRPLMGIGIFPVLFLCPLLHMSKFIRNFAADFESKLKTPYIMKNKFLLFAAAILLFTACEQEKQVAQNPIISFEYREIAPEAIEFRSTSTPSYIAPDLWYYFASAGVEIGDGHHKFPSIGTYNVSVLYKPGVAPEHNAVHASRNFTIDITGVVDSVWHSAIPVE